MRLRLVCVLRQLAEMRRESVKMMLPETAVCVEPLGGIAHC
jgi:hypothetical protein